MIRVWQGDITTLDVCAIVNAATFLPSDQHDPAAIGIVAATVGGVRLIDNLDFSVTRA